MVSMSTWRTDHNSKVFSRSQVRPRSTDGRLESLLYLYDMFARQVVQRPADDATRRGWSIEVAGHTGDDPFEDDSQRLNLSGKLKTAHQWARLQGGSIVMLLLDDGATLDAEPRNVRGIKALHVFARSEVQPVGWNEDITSPQFGHPSAYLIGQTEVHHSRVIPFFGEEIPPDAALGREDTFWGQSVVQAVQVALDGVNSASEAVNRATDEYQYGILKLRNLGELIAAGAADPGRGLNARMDAIDKARAQQGMILLDSEESYELRNVQMQSLLEAYGIQQQNLSAATRIPISLLFGQAPKGFANTDETGLTNYWDGIRAIQDDVYRPAIRRVIELLAEAMDITAEFRVEFRDLETPSEKDIADTRKVYAEIDQMNIKNGVYTAQEARRRYEGAEFTESLVVEAASEMDEADDAVVSALMDRLRAESV